jgi:hypothetical protein
LVGAGLGAVAIIPLLPLIGPGGALVCASGLIILCAGLFSEQKRLLKASAVISLIVMLDTRWDPISKIDIVENRDRHGNFLNYHVAYDGGQQSSYFFPFDGDYQKLRQGVENADVIDRSTGFWAPNVLASHYLKRDTDAEVLIIGSAGGQETKAALTFGAKHVDAVEMVNAVIEYAKGKYNDVIGGIFNHPAVNVVNGEGRSFLRSADKHYDIIQIYSNHTSSSIGAGNGAISTVYLQTVEAYKEYYQHLKADGVLHVNHHYYPQMIVAAAKAWKDMGRTNFRDHVIVYLRDKEVETLPTMLISMEPWTQKQLDTVSYLLHKDFVAALLYENPLDHQNSYLSEEFFSGSISDETREQTDFRLHVSTDDQPYLTFIRKLYSQLPPPEAGSNMTNGMVAMLNTQLRSGVPMDSVHLMVTAFFSVIFSFLFILLPIKMSKVGQANWPGKYYTLAYFSCLGAGFIIIELVLIQIFMKLIGFPLYTFSVVILTLLVSAGLGSLASKPMGISPSRRWLWPFSGVVLYGIVFLLIYPGLFDVFLSLDLLVRCILAGVLIFPLGFFLGMPFPLECGSISLYRLPGYNCSGIIVLLRSTILFLQDKSS